MSPPPLYAYDTTAGRAFRAAGDVLAPSVSVPLLLVAIPVMLSTILVAHKIVGG